jgi:uncharacterized 2Fe-2S/4Fe-4S cluster protein (DUF4445 family)
MRCKIRALSSEGIEQTFFAEQGGSLFAALRAGGVYLPADCGGRGSCGKCAVRIIAGSLPAAAADRSFFSREELEAGWRLACSAVPDGDIVIEVPAGGEGQFSAVDVFTLAPTRAAAGNAPLYAIAVDIGTTTLAFSLLDTRSGTILSRSSATNRQREFGGDVISRIQRANGGDLPLLSRCVRRQIAGCIAPLCAGAGLEPRSIGRMAITGNTTMLHLFLGLSCETLGKAPFTPVTLELLVKNSGEIFGDDLAVLSGMDCEVVILPGISTYVGADITAGIFFTGLYRNAETTLLIDIGTNGEMVLVHDGNILCAATAAGPAFEGGNIRWGAGSVAGAISRVWFTNGAFEVGVIGEKPPLGICGSGVVDVVYQCRKNGLIAPSGRFDESVPDEGIVLARASDGRNIVFCQKDVRELQLAKSAIRTGLDALLNHASLDYASVSRLYIAGGFGFNLNLESAAGIGLVPEALLPKVSRIGNSALGGAVQYLLNPGCEETLRSIARQSVEFNLPNDAYFSVNFIDNINFAD